MRQIFARAAGIFAHGEARDAKCCLSPLRHIGTAVAPITHMSRYLRIFILGALAVATAHPATAQNTSGILNVFDVQRLVVADTPEAHTALAKHFIALAGAYSGDATRYRALATLPGANPNHPVGTNTRERRMRQAEVAAAAQRTVRAVAAHHQMLSMGVSSRRPAGAAAFDGGKGAPLPSAAELDKLVGTARTAAAERELVEYFLIVARTETANAEAYARTARMMRVSGARNTEGIAGRYEHLASAAREAAGQANVAAELHRQLGAIG